MSHARRGAVALAIAAVFAVLSCSAPAPTEVGAAGMKPDASLLGDLVGSLSLIKCSPQPYDSVTQTVGTGGGTITVGANTLRIPAGALSQAVTITAVAPSDTVNRVVFQPQGLQFQKAAYLTMSYANCNLLGSLLPPQIVYTDDNLNILQVLASLDDLFTRKVTAPLRHFSDYAVAW